jgi:hypothetical protein
MGRGVGGEGRIAARYPDPLTPALSHEYRGEGVLCISRRPIVTLVLHSPIARRGRIPFGVGVRISLRERSRPVKDRPFLLKLATLASSLFLVSGFIAYRAGALNRLMADGAPLPATPAVQTPGDTASEAVFFPGSKSAAIVPGTSQLDTFTNAGFNLDVQITPTILPGEVHRAPSQEQTISSPQPSVPVIMPTTKSGGVFLPTDLIVLPAPPSPIPPTPTPAPGSAAPAPAAKPQTVSSPAPVPQSAAPPPAAKSVPVQQLFYGSKAPVFNDVLPGLMPAPATSPPPDQAPATPRTSK